MLTSVAETIQKDQTTKQITLKSYGVLTYTQLPIRKKPAIANGKVVVEATVQH